jgi:hypothetical protein
MRAYEKGDIMHYFWINIILLFEICILAGGLSLLHFAKKENAHLLKTAGSVLVIGALLLMPATAYQLYGGYANYSQNAHQGWAHGDRIWKSERHSQNKKTPASEATNEAP